LKRWNGDADLWRFVCVVGEFGDLSPPASDSIPVCLDLLPPPKATIVVSNREVVKVLVDGKKEQSEVEMRVMIFWEAEIQAKGRVLQCAIRVTRSGLIFSV
jgi:hypothetical protein